MANRQRIIPVGKPYFLKETSGGILRAVLAINEIKDGWTYSFDDSIGELLLGQDLQEVSTHGLSILVTHSIKELQAEHVISELRKFAKLAWYDYVSAEMFGNCCLCRSVAIKDDISYVEARPRLFRKIKDG